MKTLLLLVSFFFSMALQAQFSGQYAHTNWQTQRNAGSNGYISGTSTSRLIINGSNDEDDGSSGSFYTTEYTLLAQSSGTWQFRWDYITHDEDGPTFDKAYVVIDGIITYLTDDEGDDVQSGVYNGTHVPANTRIGFGVVSTDNISGNAVLTITAFLAPGYLLPVRFTTITATPLENRVKINWTTAEEQNNNRFEVQRLGTDNTYHTIGLVFANIDQASTGAYGFTDPLPLPGRNYYRIKQVDHDETYMYSTAVCAAMENPANLNMTVFPSPAINHITVKLKNNESGILSLYTVNGQVAGSKTAVNGQGFVNWDISHLMPGIYIIKAASGISASFIKK